MRREYSRAQDRDRTGRGLRVEMKCDKGHGVE